MKYIVMTHNQGQIIESSNFKDLRVSSLIYPFIYENTIAKRWESFLLVSNPGLELGDPKSYFKILSSPPWPPVKDSPSIFFPHSESQ